MVKRRRACPNCGARFTTYERIDNRELKVVKRSGAVKLFDSSKLQRSIEIACRKRPVTEEQLEQMVANITTKLEKFGDGEIPSQTIGQLVMKELAVMDRVACIRYASVYMEFSEPSDFGKFIASIDHG
jgi:transcriptional repressor NrdR